MALSGGQNGKKRCGVTELPDCILESIVSLLPLKAAVETSLVCPQWRHLSRPILKRRNLEFDYLNVFGITYPNHDHDVEKMRRDFVRRVDKFLQQYEGNKVDSFKLLHCFLFPEYHAILDGWIRFAITKGVEQVDLRPSLCSNPQDYYLFPHRLLSEQLSAGSPLNLKYLSLENCTLRPPLDFHGFNQLTTLHLNQVIVGPSLMENLFSVCPLLESLTLNWCQMTRPSHLNVVAGDRLTDLKVLNCNEGTKLEISALNLASLEYIPCYFSRFVSMKTPRLERIYFSDTRVRGTILPKALVQFALCPGLEILHLQMPGETFRFRSLPAFGNLKLLNLSIDVTRFYRKDKDDLDPVCVLHLLEAAPVLEELVMTVNGLSDLSWTNDQRAMMIPSRFTHDHLKLVTMQSFKANWYQLALAICILENTPNLQMMVVAIDQSANMYSKQHIGVVQVKLMGVKTNAQIIYL